MQAEAADYLWLYCSAEIFDLRLPMADDFLEFSITSFAWSIAEILRGDFKQSEYGKVVLLFVVLRRLDCILEPTKDAVVAAYDNLPEGIDDKM